MDDEKIKQEELYFKSKIEKINETALKYINTDPQKVIELSKEALIIAKEKGYKEHIAASLNNLGIGYSRLNDVDKAHTSFFQALEIRNETGELSKIADIHNNLGILFYKQSQYSTALEHFKKKIELLSKQNEKIKVAKTYNQVGVVYKEISELTVAVSYYLKAMKIFEEENYDPGISQTLNNLANVNLLLGNYSKSLEYFERALKSKQELQDKVGIANILNNIGELYFKIPDLNSAKIFFEDSLDIFTTLNHQHGMAITNNNLGKLFIALNNYEKAIFHIKSSIENYEKINDKRGIANAKKDLGFAYLKIKKFEEAFTALNDSLFIAKFFDIKDLMRDNYQKISEYYFLKKDYENSLIYYKYYSEIKDEILNETTSNKIMELQTKYETEKKEKEAQQYKLENIELQIQNKEVISQNTLIINQNKLLSSIINNIPHPISIKDVNLKYILINKHFEDYIGFKNEEIKGKNITEIYNHELAKILRDEDYSILTNLKTIQIEKRLTSHTGKVFDAIIVKAPILDENNKSAGIISTIIDVSELKESEKKILQSEQKLKEINESKDRFFSILAHDLKNPLSGLLLTIEHLSDKFDQLDETKIRKFIYNMERSAKNLSKLLNNLLEWASTQTGKIQFNPEHFNLSELVIENININKELLKNKNISIINNVPSDEVIFADKNMFATIIRNILTNAIKYSYENSNITFSFYEKGSSVTLEIKDQGIGMSEETLNNLFCVDKVQSQRGTRGEIGTGLGLIICKEFIEINNGEIFVNSKIGKGTTFKIKIPRIK